MTRRTPEQILAVANPQAALGAVEAEIAGERAAALGRLGREVEGALATLAQAGPEGRGPLIDAAAAAVWRYFVQREACGLPDQRQPILDYGIPPEVLRRVGAIA